MPQFSRPGFLKSALFSGMMVFASVAYTAAQNNSLDLPPLQRTTSTLSTPYGASASYSYASLKSMESTYSGYTEFVNITDLPALIGASIYYDTWLIGFQRQMYGDVIRVANRMPGRSFASMLYFEIGSFGQNFYSQAYDQYTDEQVIRKDPVKLPVMALGYFTSWPKVAPSKEVSVSFIGDNMLGISTYDDKNAIFGAFAYGARVRIPFLSHAVNLDGQLMASALPPSNRIAYGDFDAGTFNPSTDPVPVFGFVLTAGFVLGFEH